MGKAIDMTGWIMKERGFPNSRVTILRKESKSSSKDSHAYWLCKCDCGTTFIASGRNLRCGRTLSCGCLRSELGSIRNSTHRMSGDRIYYIWASMKSRCYNKNNKRYEQYGGRGIKVCENWRNSFEKFEKWACENGYDERLTIDRINVNGNYEPSNCRWVSMSIQANNKRSNIIINYNGRSMTLAQWSVETGINCSTLRYRLYELGWSIDRALTESVHNTRRK